MVDSNECVKMYGPTNPKFQLLVYSEALSELYTSQVECMGKEAIVTKYYSSVPPLTGRK
jgi:hypothetical protein